MNIASVTQYLFIFKGAVDTTGWNKMGRYFVRYEDVI